MRTYANFVSRISASSAQKVEQFITANPRGRLVRVANTAINVNLVIQPKKWYIGHKFFRNVERKNVEYLCFRTRLPNILLSFVLSLLFLVFHRFLLKVHAVLQNFHPLLPNLCSLHVFLLNLCLFLSRVSGVFFQMKMRRLISSPFTLRIIKGSKTSLRKNF